MQEQKISVVIHVCKIMCITSSTGTLPSGSFHPGNTIKKLELSLLKWLSIIYYCELKT